MSEVWEDFAEEFGPLVYASAWRILRHRQEAEDVTQDVFAHAWAHRDETVRNMGGWMRNLAVCRALDRLRRRRIVSLNELAVPQSGSEPHPLEAAELELAVRNAVAALPEQQATVFALRYFEEMSNREIAEHLVVTASTVSSALHAARKSLAKTLAPVWKECAHECVE